MTDEDVRRLYPGPLVPPSPTAPQSVDELIARLATVRRLGFAKSHDESNRGVGAIAVAVGDPENGEEVSLCIVYPASMIGPAQRQAIIDGLRNGAVKSRQSPATFSSPSGAMRLRRLPKSLGSIPFQPKAVRS